MADPAGITLIIKRCALEGQPLDELHGPLSVRTDEIINVFHQCAQLGGDTFVFLQTWYMMSAYLVCTCLWLHFFMVVSIELKDRTLNFFPEQVLSCFRLVGRCTECKNENHFYK